MQCVSIYILQDSISEDSENFTVVITESGKTHILGEYWLNFNPDSTIIVIEGNAPVRTALFYV